METALRFAKSQGGGCSMEPGGAVGLPPSFAESFGFRRGKRRSRPVLSQIASPSPYPVQDFASKKITKVKEGKQVDKEVAKRGE